MRITEKTVPPRRHVNDVKRLVRTNVATARARWSNLGGSAVSLLKELTTNYLLCVALGDLILLEGRWYVTQNGLLRLARRKHSSGIRVQPVSDFCAEATRLLGDAVRLRVIGGGVRPRTYTGAAMNNFAYAHQVVQQAGRLMPNAFLLPMSKTAAWWAKDWMERHTYFLPRYDDEGRVKNEGHALASAAGISCLLRRTYKSTSEPAPEGAYDFVTYFECADADVPTFHQVCASLRDVARNPEWTFVREGPTWHGRRVAGWPDLFTGRGK